VRVEHFYEEAQRDEKSPIRMAFALQKSGPLASYEEFADQLDPAPESWRGPVFRACMASLGDHLDFCEIPRGVPRQSGRSPWRAPPRSDACFAWGFCVSLLPWYRATLGVWAILAVGYVMGVFLVSQTNVRYFAPAWPCSWCCLRCRGMCW